MRARCSCFQQHLHQLFLWKLRCNSKVKRLSLVYVLPTTAHNKTSCCQLLHTATHLLPTTAYSNTLCCQPLHTIKHRVANFCTQQHIVLPTTAHSNTLCCQPLHTATHYVANHYTQQHIVSPTTAHSNTLCRQPLHTATHCVANHCTQQHIVSPTTAQSHVHNVLPTTAHSHVHNLKRFVVTLVVLTQQWNSPSVSQLSSILCVVLEKVIFGQTLSVTCFLLRTQHKMNNARLGKDQEGRLEVDFYVDGVS